jgi:hypothetical protein
VCTTASYEGISISHYATSAKGETVRPNIVLTGFEETRPILMQRGGEFISGPTTHYLVFNEGAFRVPCDEETFQQIVEYWKYTSAPTKAQDDDLPAGVELFTATKAKEDIPPPPPDSSSDNDDDWTGTQDDADDGVGQL